MKTKILMFAGALSAISATASAAPFQFRGSDTLFGAVTDAINQSGLQSDLQYLGGGSGLGEKGLVAGTQGIAPMSRALAAAAKTSALAAGITLTENVVGLDGVALFVKASESPVQIDLPTLANMFAGSDGSGSDASCAAADRIKDWSQVPGSGKSGAIAAFRRNDDSGTTDTFKNLVGVKGFCKDVTILATTADISETTSTNAAAIGYSGMSGERAGQNKALSISRTVSDSAVAPSADTIRNFSYPLARRLYVNVSSGAHTPNASETSLLSNLLDRSFMDPILVANEFITCATSGCP